MVYFLFIHFDLGICVKFCFCYGIVVEVGSILHICRFGFAWVVGLIDFGLFSWKSICTLFFIGIIEPRRKKKNVLKIYLFISISLCNSCVCSALSCCFFILSLVGLPFVPCLLADLIDLLEFLNNFSYMALSGVSCN